MFNNHKRGPMLWLIAAVLLLGTAAQGDTTMNDPADQEARLFMPYAWAMWLPDVAAAQDFADAWKSRTLNGCGFQILWDKIEPEQGKFDWQWLDERLDVFVNAGLRVHLRFATQNNRPSWFKARMQRGPDGELISTGDRTLVSFADVDAQQTIARTLSKVAEHVWTRYEGQSPYPVVAMLVQCSRPAETEYAHDEWSDFSGVAQDDFRTWLQSRFESIDELNEAWGTRYADFSQITLQDAHIYDFNHYRTFALARAIKTYADGIHQTPGAEAAVQFGSVWDGLSVYRGTRDVRALIEPVEWVMVDDYPIYDHAHSMDHLRGHARDKMWGNEIDGPGIVTDELGLEQCITSARRGAKFLFAANWNAESIRRTDRTFWEKVMVELQKPAPDISPTRAIVASLATVYRQEPQQGVNGTYHDLYARLSDNSKNPVDILTDTAIITHPEWLEQYTDGIYISAEQLWMTYELVDALTDLSVPVYVENRQVAMFDEYSRARSGQPESWKIDPQQ